MNPAVLVFLMEGHMDGLTFGWTDGQTDPLCDVKKILKTIDKKISLRD